MARDKITKIAIAGGIAGAATPLLLKLIMPILNALGSVVPAVSLKLANPGTLEANIRGSLTGINAGAAKWLTDSLGVTVPTNAIMPYIMAAIGGAILFIAGDWIADKIGWLKGNARQKVTAVIFTGSAVLSIVLGGFVLPQIGITFANTLIAMGINAAILAWAFVAIDNQFKLGLNPY